MYLHAQTTEISEKLDNTFYRSSQRRCSIKKVFLKNSQNSKEDAYASVSFLKNRLSNRCFPVNLAKFLRTPFYRIPLDDCFWNHCYLLKYHLKYLLLKSQTLRARLHDTRSELKAVWDLKPLWKMSFQLHGNLHWYFTAATF